MTTANKRAVQVSDEGSRSGKARCMQRASLMRTTGCLVAVDDRRPVGRTPDLHADRVDVVSNVRHVTSNHHKMAAVYELAQRLTALLHHVT